MKTLREAALARAGGWTVRDGFDDLAWIEYGGLRIRVEQQCHDRSVVPIGEFHGTVVNLLSNEPLMGRKVLRSQSGAWHWVTPDGALAAAERWMWRHKQWTAASGHTEEWWDGAEWRARPVPSTQTPEQAGARVDAMVEMMAVITGRTTDEVRRGHGLPVDDGES